MRSWSDRPSRVLSKAYDSNSIVAVVLRFSCAFSVFCVVNGAVRAQDANQSGPAPPAATSEAATGNGPAALSRRVEQLEEQIIDLQVVIGTLESLATSGGSGAGAQRYSPGSGDFNSAGDSGRVAVIETQIRALTSQIERLSLDVQALQSTSGPRGALSAAPAPADPARSSGFGATVVHGAEARSPDNDAIGNLLNQNKTNSSPAADAATLDGQAAALGEAGDGTAPAASPKMAYEAAYGHLLQQNYGAAQAGFSEFLRKFPKDALVPNALYWLGETYYVQQNYADAAEAFDIVTAAYASSNKAPDSQLKRAMSLANLGKRNEACSAFRTLASRYPNAPEHVKNKADSESQRVGCS